MGNAGKRSKATRSITRPLPPLPEKQGGSGKTLRTLPGTSQPGEQIAEALALVIPCRIDKKKSIAPLFLVTTVIVNGIEIAESAVWQCQGCAMIFHSRKGWSRHCGLIGQDNKISDICAGA